MEKRSGLQNSFFSAHENEQVNAGPHDLNFSAMESVAEPQLLPVDSKVSVERLSVPLQIASRSPVSSPYGTHSSVDASDRPYQPVGEALDDEQTLEDEEKNGDADDGELDELERLGELPLEELLRMYGGSTAGTSVAPVLSSPRPEEEVNPALIVAGPSPVRNEDGGNNAETVFESSLLSTNTNDEDDWTTSSDDEVYGADGDDRLPEEDRSKLLKFLASITGEGLGEGSDDSSSDDEFIPLHLMSMLKREVPVGPNRQIEPPKFNAQYDEVLSTADFPDEVLQWAPYIRESDVVEYLKAAYIQECELLKKEIPPEQLAQNEVADDEEFLKELLDCNYDKDEALRRCRRNFRPGRYESSKWSEKECEDFEAAIMDNWKRFNIVQAAVPTRTVKEVVEFYYRWKKSSRFEPFLARVRCADGKTQHMLEEKVKLRMNGKKRPLDAMDTVAEDQLVEVEKEKVPLEPRAKSARLESASASCASSSETGSAVFFVERTVTAAVSQDLIAQAGPSGS